MIESALNLVKTEISVMRKYKGLTQSQPLLFFKFFFFYSSGFSLQSINISMTCNISTHYEKERQSLPFLFNFPKQLT